MTMQTEESYKKTCRRCGGMGHFLSYEAPHVKRKYCDCETGKKGENFIKEQLKTKDVQPVWELFTI